MGVEKDIIGASQGFKNRFKSQIPRYVIDSIGSIASSSISLET